MYDRSLLCIGSVLFGIHISAAAGSPLGVMEPHLPFDQIRCVEACEASTILAANKFFAPKKIKVGPKGKMKTMTKSQLRSKNPAVYRLYKKTEKAALDYQSGGTGSVPLTCSITPNYINCNASTWFCTIYFNNLLASQCGPQPPFVPKPS